MGKEHVIEDAYMTDELDSGDDDDSCDERPCVIKFNQEESLSKDFVFKVGMEFSSLCSRVLTSTIFRIKTLFAKHKYGRQFFNKSDKAEWVAKVIVDGLKNNSRIRLK
ncbi:unnamed protein product [Lathyrus sativus]|nr:unnamed protein product [Lathyrus sativus]